MIAFFTKKFICLFDFYALGIGMVDFKYLHLLPDFRYAMGPGIIAGTHNNQLRHVLIN